MKTKNLKWLYEEFSKSDSSFSYKEFKSIIENYNKELINEVILGKGYNFGHLLGSLRFIVKERKMRISKDGKAYSSIDWKESDKLKESLIKEGKQVREAGSKEGENWLVYNLSNKMLKFYWNRYRTKSKDGKINFPLERIRNYHLSVTQINCRNLYKNNKHLIE